LENKKIILLIGESGSGKTSSLRNMPLDETVYIDIDRKSIKSFKDMDKFNQWVKLDYVDHLLPGLEAIEKDDTCKYVVIDTLSFLMDLFVTQRVDTAADTRAEWGNYKKFYKEIINFAKTSKKSFIFLAHPKTVYNEQEMESKTYAYAQGSIASKIEADFAVVAYTRKYLNEDGLPSFGFSVGLTKETLHTSVKSPMSMFSEPTLDDNDIMDIFKAIDEY